MNTSQGRIDIAIIKYRNNETINDKRGVKSGGKNKITDAQLTEIKNCIEGFPRYTSHYCRDSGTSNYLAPNLNLPILYHHY